MEQTISFYFYLAGTSQGIPQAHSQRGFEGQILLSPKNSPISWSFWRKKFKKFLVSIFLYEKVENPRSKNSGYTLGIPAMHPLKSNKLNSTHTVYFNMQLLITRIKKLIPRSLKNTRNFDSKLTLSVRHQEETLIELIKITISIYLTWSCLAVKIV